MKLVLKRIVLPFLVITILALLVTKWINMPRTPKEFFEKRCTNCHDLPDLTEYTAEEIPKLVDFMRNSKNAKRYISEDEAIVIIDYIVSTKASIPVSVDSLENERR